MTTSFKHLSCADLAAMLSAEQALQIVDIRDPNSYAAGHIIGAKPLSNENLAEFLREADPDAPTVVCCYHGNSSQQAAQYLAAQDFTEVYSLDGGFSQWQLQYPDWVAR
jgi:thiosulfate sulfurtransferase